MWHYLLVFLAAMAVDLIPVFAPPAWTIMVFLLVKFHLNPWGVLCAGVLGSTLGRYIFSLYIPKVSDKLISRHKNHELQFVGKRVGKSLWKSWTFVFLYTLTPLSTTALFTAAGLARINPMHTVPPFFAGKFLSDAVLVATGHYLSSARGGVLKQMCSPTGIVTMILGALLLGALLFVDWRTLLEKRKLQFKFRIWKWNARSHS